MNSNMNEGIFYFQQYNLIMKAVNKQLIGLGLAYWKATQIKKKAYITRQEKERAKSLVTVGVTDQQKIFHDAIKPINHLLVSHFFSKTIPICAKSLKW